MSSKLPPGPRYPAPLAILKWQRQIIPLLEMAQKRYGDVWTLRLGADATFVIVSDPALVKGVLTADPTVVHGENQLATPLVGTESVLVLNEDAHITLKNLLQPYFRGERVQQYRSVIADICERDLAGWPMHEPMPLLPHFQRITLDVIIRVIFGVRDAAGQTRLRDRIVTMFGFAESPLRMTMHQIRFIRGWDPSPKFLRVKAPV